MNEPALLSDQVGWHARHRPDDEAAITGDERLSYRRLAEEVDACALGLLAGGVGHGDRVAILTTPGAAFLVSFLATASIGAIWIGLNPRHTPAELDAAIEQLQPSLVMARTEVEGRDHCGWLASLPAGIRTIALAGGDARALAPLSQGVAQETSRLGAARAAVRPDDPCLIVFTSGTSGRAKGALMSHRALVGASRVQLGQWPVRPLRVLNNLPVNHIGAVGDLACYALVGGGASIFCERFDPEASLRLIAAEQVTVLGQVPTQLELTLAADNFSVEALASLRLIFWGGAQAPAKLIERLIALGKPVATSYGQTETVGSITFTAANASWVELAGTVGAPVAPYRLRISDEDGADIAAGGQGEVQVLSPFAMSGYWRAPEATKAAFTADGWLRTGDIGTLDQAGRLRLVGRNSEVFKSGGYNIYPAEIEAALLECDGVSEAAVVALPDKLYGQVGAAAVTLKPGATASPTQIKQQLGLRLANYKTPKSIVVLGQLPKLPVGKIDKESLRNQIGGG